MDIEIGGAAGRSDHDGMTYYFCSMGCKRDFDTDPAGVLQREGEYDHSQGVDHAAMGGSEAAPKKAWWQFWKS
jgi:YHS domain-containing protein